MLRRAIRKYEAKTATPAPQGWWAPAPDYASPQALADYEAGDEYSYLQFVGMKGDGMFSRVDLARLGPDFAIPVFFVQGTEDLVATPEVAKRYVDTLRAPLRELVMVAHAGRDPNQAIVDAQYRILREMILPLVLPAQARTRGITDSFRLRRPSPLSPHA